MDYLQHGVGKRGGVKPLDPDTDDRRAGTVAECEKFVEVGVKGEQNAIVFGGKFQDGCVVRRGKCHVTDMERIVAGGGKERDRAIWRAVVEEKPHLALVAKSASAPGKLAAA